jgi:RHS repeat-associated protein
LGRLTDVVQFLDGREIRTEYGYDELGRQVWQEDALDRRTLYEYDLMGRRTAVVLPMGQRSSTVYDAVGNALKTTDFNGETAVYSYDPLNRLTFIDLPNDADVSFAYTPTGLRSSVTDERGVTSYEYDERNRLIGRTDAGKPYLTSGATIEYEYDDAGNRTLVRTPSGEVRYEFDERNQLEKVVADGGETVYSYDAVGNLVRTVLPNGVVESRSYDELNRLEFLENKSGDAVVSSYDYELDDVGNRVAVTEHDGRRVEYDYDSLYRLVSEEVVGEGTTGYVYDDVGNRLQKVDSVETTYRYDDNDLLLEESSGGDVVVYEYDDNGNTISITSGSEETVYVWDERNRLVEVRFADGKVVGYGYDDGNIRISQVVDGVETRFLLDKNRAYAQVLEEYVDGTLDAEYVYGGDLISLTRDGVDFFYLVDGLGSVRGLTDASGGVVADYSYDAFGNLVGSSGDVENDYLFAGEQFDGELGQYYLRQRFYDSGTGRFTRRDVYEGNIENPASLHKYLYTGGNPVNATDPTGLYTLAEAQAATAIANTLAGIQVEVGLYLVDATLRGGDYELQDFLSSLAISGGLTAIGPLLQTMLPHLKRIRFAGAASERAGQPLPPKFLVNPGYPGSALDPTVGNLPRNMNCVNCALKIDEILGAATELTGDAMIALPNLSARQISINDINKAYNKELWDWMEISSKTHLESVLMGAGEGARGIVYGARKVDKRAAHVFNAVNLGGEVMFIDGQVGRYANLDEFTDLLFLGTN